MFVKYRVLNIWIGALALLILSGNLQAQVRKYSNEFLAIGVGARGLGMSNAVAATSNDITSAYWNPAGLNQIKSNVQLAGMHAEYFAGISKLDYAGVGFRVDSASVVGFTMIRFGVDDIPNTIDLIDANGNVDYNNITTFSAADYAFLLSYARKLKIPGLSMGANGKIIHRKVGEMARAWGFGIDLGFTYKKKALTLALVGKDITTTVNAWSFDLNERTKEVFALTGNEIPENSTEITAPRIILAAAYEFNIKDKVFIQPELNVDFTTDGKRNVLIPGDPISLDPHVGLEASYKKIVFLRGGIGNIQKEKNDFGNRSFTTIQPNIGIGFSFKKITVDYALTDIGDQSAGLYSHVFSLKVDFYKGIAVQRYE